MTDMRWRHSEGELPPPSKKILISREGEVDLGWVDRRDGGVWYRGGTNYAAAIDYGPFWWSEIPEPPEEQP